VLRKVLSIGERMKRDFRVQAYDLFNHPQFEGAGDTNISDYLVSGND
jgi:hypothetical protein